MTLAYSPGGELGGENKEIIVGEWEEFRVSLTNDSPPTASPWENILIRVKFYGVENEEISLGYKHDGVWENSQVYDLRSLEQGMIGVVADLGPARGWTVKPQTTENFDLRVKIDKVVKDVKVEMLAITNESTLGAGGEKVENLESKNILDPLQDTYIHQGNPSTNYSGEDYLELTTQENGNAHALLEFDRQDIPNQVGSAELNLYQYWGSGFSDLRDSGITVQAFPIAENLNLNSVTWKTTPVHNATNPIAEEEIQGTNKSYNFNMTNYLNSLENEKIVTVLLKFSQDNFDNKERRIRFDSLEGENPPYLIIQ
ncbi:hypothetical protein AKJ48_02340 [candidate division MSBL1 archaeon SCGC-AAA261O19]|uniref:Carbohydrate-binding module family 96 domain-containing protein n=1 Tax=candidate division MSBL1 archaeon SCGC-AAA261O19 TaxID=1698277 RepID=A0A133VDI8_9EURY|nr:hypothetical protein AKJ48_02340 [candidate division MSBL1 archaeon SCGC-AAA261O19]